MAKDKVQRRSSFYAATSTVQLVLEPLARTTPQEQHLANEALCTRIIEALL